QGFILGEHSHRIDLRIDAVAQAEVNDAVLPAKGNGGFGDFFRQGSQAAPLPSGQQHGDDFLFGHLLSSSLLQLRQGTRQISPAYSFTVRSAENKPALAMLIREAFCQARRWPYSCSSRCQVST